MSLLNKISDIELADAICNQRDISLLSSLQKEMMNDLFYHSRKLASRTASIDSGYFSGWRSGCLEGSVSPSTRLTYAVQPAAPGPGHHSK